MPAPIHSNSQQIRNDQKELKTHHNTKTKLSNTGIPHSTNTPGRNRVGVTPNKPQLLKITCTDKDTQKSSMVTPDIRSTLTPVFSARKNSLFNTPSNNRKSIFVSKQISNEVTQKLSEWLEIKGKSFKEYHHLKCFGVHAENAIKALHCDGEKENIENSVIIENNNFIKEPPATPQKINLPAVAQTALVDLHKLILDGYPPEQCDIWLKLIKQKCGQVEEEPQYWECRAALEQTKGNINLAVECYKTAIIQGAEVQNVDKCLDQLLQKFSLLNICNESGPHVNKNDRNKIVQDARNIFKSSIIQFAVQEKVLKKKTSEGTTVEKRVFATPVRRSTRLSRSAFTSTPGIHIYSSLQELDASVRDNLNFQCNSALKD
ncbi:hypothetical protein Zmor_005610 [Zophobas morio]|uniref:Uncharacterized protein n=1 Tax=Zophobas morio TaxID=2755281 RepID=A0AA38IQ52_9CUCU|nr:hypothetical protein Zmor_005610 [Zophobas morio]